MGLAKQWQETLFQQVHGNNLVYNTCWEDPRCDRTMLGLNSQSRVVMLTSAGCNALDYLLDGPASVFCVDLNHRQNALLALKASMFQGATHEQLYAFFGDGSCNEARRIYKAQLRPLLGREARFFWDKKIGSFDGRGMRKSFYWYGTSGTVAWLISRWLRSRPALQQLVEKLFEAPTLELQRAVYEQLEPKLLTPFVRWLVGLHLVQSMLGVPKSQQNMAKATFEEGMAGYIRACFRQVFTQLPLHDNYFWKLYFYGRYTPDCCPNYLLPQHFETLRERTDRLTTFTGPLSGFLRDFPGKYTHFVLLDHQDWLAAHLRPALEEEWRLMLDNAAPGAKFLLRSASAETHFLPDFVNKHVRFDAGAASISQAADRVGTYAGTFIGTLR